MSRRTLGILAVVGSAIGAWWAINHRRASGANRRAAAARDRGIVIFDNTPAASDVSAIL